MLEQEVVLAPYGQDRVTHAPYPPHPTQQVIRDWCRKVRAGQASVAGIPVYYCQHGVNSGGTRAVLTPAIEYLLEEAGLNVLIGRKDFNDLRLSGMETFLTVMPPELVVDQNVQEHRYVIRAQGGTSQVFFRELKDTKGLGSQEFGVIVVIEAHELTLPMYRTLKQRCRQGQRPSFILLEGNPPPEGHWLLNLADPHHADYDPDLTMIKLPSTENYAFMTTAYRNMLDQMPANWRKRYVLAEAAALPDGTPVYPAFVDSVHVRETQIVPDRPIIRGWDFGLRRAACVWGQRTDAGQMLWHREWLAIETPETQFIEGVKVRTKEWFGDRVCLDYGDPAATQRDPHGVSTLARLQEAGITLRWKVTTYGQRIPLINRLLCELIQGVPKLVISPFCKILIEGLMGGYHYPELQMDKEFTAKKDLPVRDGWFEHICNALEYALVNLFLPNASAIQEVIHHRQERFRRQRLQQKTTVAF